MQDTGRTRQIRHVQRPQGGTSNQTKKQQHHKQTFQPTTLANRSIVTEQHSQGRTTDGLASGFRACGAVNRFVGSVNEQYRLFVCAADLLAENVKEPWQTLSRPPDTEWTAAVDFIKQQNGPHDVQAAFDGRMRACRVLADEHLGNDNQEIFLTYTGELRRACRTRRTVLSASTCEVGLVRLPGDRANWKLKKRGGTTMPVERAGRAQPHIPGWCFAAPMSCP